MNLSCLRCGSKALIPNADVFVWRGLFGKLRIGLRRLPWFRLGPTTSPVAGFVCSVCGHVEFALTDAAPVVGRYRMQVKADVEAARSKGTVPSIDSCPQCLTLLSENFKCGACGWSFELSTSPDGTA